MSALTAIIVQWQRSVKKESRGYATVSSGALALSSSQQTLLTMRSKCVVVCS